MKIGQRTIARHKNWTSRDRGMVWLLTALLATLTGTASWAVEAPLTLPNSPSVTPTTATPSVDNEQPIARPSDSLPKLLPRPTQRAAGTPPSWYEHLPRPSSQTVIVLGIVAGLALVWRLTRGGERHLPSDLVEVYGRVPLNPKQHLHLVRVGNTLLVLIESGQGLQRLAEIRDPEEVRRITERFRREGKRAVPPELSDVVSAGRHLASFRSA